MTMKLIWLALRMAISLNYYSFYQRWKCCVIRCDWKREKSIFELNYHQSSRDDDSWMNRAVKQKKTHLKGERRGAMGEPSLICPNTLLVPLLSSNRHVSNLFLGGSNDSLTSFLLRNVSSSSSSAGFRFFRSSRRKYITFSVLWLWKNLLKWRAWAYVWDRDERRSERTHKSDQWFSNLERNYLNLEIEFFFLRLAE